MTENLPILSQNKSTSVQLSDVFTAPTIWQLENKGGHSKRSIKLVICEIVTKKLDNFNLTLPMTKEQTVVFAEEWVALYYTDTLEDLVMMFRYVISGRVGKIYNRVDPRTLFEWYREYLEIKLAEKEVLHKEKIGVVRPEPKKEKREMPPQLLELIEKLKKKPFKESSNEKTEKFKPTQEKFVASFKGLSLGELTSLQKQLKNASIHGNYDDELKEIKELIENKQEK